MSLFDRFKAGLARTRQQFRDRFDEIAGAADTPEMRSRPDTHGTRSASVGVDTLDALEEVLIGADVGVAATDAIVKAVKADRSGDSLRDKVKHEIRRVLADAGSAPAIVSRPHVILVVGVNGTGKTTSVGKLAAFFERQGLSPIICAADTFRAAAVEQLEVWATRAGVDFIRAKPGSDPAAVVYDAAAAARSRGRGVLLVDTAGRLHTRTNLMAELDKIRRVAAREVPGAPHEVLLVLDATVGQNGIVQAREFMQAAGVTGIVLTKLDGTAKGGVAVAIAHDLKLPIRFVGVGEAIDDLLPFDAGDYVNALFEEKW